MKLGRFRPILRAYGLSIAVWCGLALLTGVQYRIFDKEMNIHSSLFDMLLLAESRGFAFALLTPPIFFLARRSIDGTRNRFRYILGYCLGVGPFMVLYACIRWAVLPPWDAGLQQYVPRSAHGPLVLIHQGFADQITMYIAIVVAAHAYQYFEKVRKQEIEKYEFQRALAASELQALKMQLHPHFLFNTLHGISTLIDTDQASAKAMVVKVSSLLRRTLEHSSSDLIPLSEELKFVREYLDLEQMRLGPRLTVEWSIEPNTLRNLVPQLILQPLVENAVRHGVACSREGGWVEITSRKREGSLELRIRNSLGGNRTAGLGVGLKNTDARLRYLYADEATFAFADEEQTAAATLVLPALGSNPGQSESPNLDLEILDRGRLASP
ncbi:MAG TPA: histidine kinase [Candidatus Sulfotelmatobacter sp.]|nr:histidine kinase [Candidatus Sulfotelmatobacter sp.]